MSLETISEKTPLIGYFTNNYIASSEGIHVHDDKVKVIHDWACQKPS